MDELVRLYGRAITPNELAYFFGLYSRTVKNYYFRWKGIEVIPGKRRFFENLVKEWMKDALQDNEAGETKVESLSNVKRSNKRKAFSGCNHKIETKYSDLGKGNKRINDEDRARYGMYGSREWGIEYLKEVESRYSHKTFLEKKAALNRFDEYLNNDVNVEDLTPGVVLKF